MRPNNHCGECVIWLALGEEGGISREDAIENHCSKCSVYNAKYADECISCPHQGLCFAYLEIAGGITREGRPICAQCNEIKADPEKMEKQLKELIEKWKRVIESAHAEGGNNDITI